MPSVSEKQKRFMRAAAHNESFADKAGIPQSVAKEFSDADEKRMSRRTGKHATRRAKTKLGNRPS